MKKYTVTHPADLELNFSTDHQRNLINLLMDDDSFRNAANEEYFLNKEGRYDHNELMAYVDENYKELAADVGYVIKERV